MTFDPSPVQPPYETQTDLSQSVSTDRASPTHDLVLIPQSGWLQLLERFRDQLLNRVLGRLIASRNVFAFHPGHRSGP